MIVRAQRFSRVHRLLPRLAKRTLAEETPRVVPNEDTLPSAGPVSPEPQETLHTIQMRKTLDLRKEAIGSLKLPVRNPVSDNQNHTSEDQIPIPGAHGPVTEVQRPLSEVHWALSGCYEVGGQLQHGKGPLHRHDEKGLPTWGDWGICINVTGWGGSSALILYASLLCTSSLRS